MLLVLTPTTTLAIASEPVNLLEGTPYYTEVIEEIEQASITFFKEDEVEEPTFKQGLVSWYGDGFRGRKTASGRIFNPDDPTIAAHLSLPFGTVVRLMNPDNGRSLDVTVWDYGPCHGDRVFDVSKAAAAKLGFKNQGTATLEYEIIKLGSRARPKVPCPTKGLRYG